MGNIYFLDIDWANVVGTDDRYDFQEYSSRRSPSPSPSLLLLNGNEARKGLRLPELIKTLFQRRIFALRFLIFFFAQLYKEINLKNPLA